MQWLLDLRRGYEDAPVEAYGRAQAPRVCDPNLRTVNGFTALLTATVRNHIEAVQVLATSPRVDLEAGDAGGGGSRPGA